MRVEPRETVDQILLNHRRVLIDFCQNKETAMRHHNNDIDDSVYQSDHIWRFPSGLIRLRQKIACLCSLFD